MSEPTDLERPVLTPRGVREVVLDCLSYPPELQERAKAAALGSLVSKADARYRESDLRQLFETALTVEAQRPAGSFLLRYSDEEAEAPPAGETVAIPPSYPSDARATAQPVAEGQPRVWTLRELLANPALVELPPPTVPRLAWPGRSTLVAAPEKLGKSTLATAAVAGVSNGSSFLGAPTKVGTALWATEEHVGDVARRLRDFGANPDRVHIMLWGSDALVEIRAEVERLRPALVVLDTLAAVAENVAPESGSASQWAAIMRPLVRIARDFDCALLILHHSRRTDGQYRDSSEIGAAVDVIAEVSGAVTGNVRKIAYRGRYGRGSFTVELVGREYQLIAGDDGRDSGRTEEAVLAFLGANPGASKRSIRAGVAGRNGDIDGALAGLVAAGRVLDDGAANARSYRVVPVLFATVPRLGAHGSPESPAVPHVPTVPRQAGQGFSLDAGHGGPYRAPCPIPRDGHGTKGDATGTPSPDPEEDFNL